MLQGYKILVAEDNPLNQKIATFMLQKQGAEVGSAYNGREAIMMLEQQPYDLILMDIQMPEMDGHEAATYIRNVMKSDIPIIAVSAGNIEFELNKSAANGMNTCIMKPYDAKVVCDTILNLIQKNKFSSEKKCI